MNKKVLWYALLPVMFVPILIYSLVDSYLEWMDNK
jgi:hypothetical protein